METLGGKIRFITITLGIPAIFLYFYLYGLDPWQRGKIFHGSSYMRETPGDLGLQYTEQWIDVAATGDVEASKMHAWWIPASAPVAPAILFLHGNAGSISSNIRYVQMLHAAGFSILAVDYRGYGKSSSGLPSENSVYVDARAAWERLLSLAPNAQKHLVYGHSLGGAIAIDLATKAPSIDGLIIESSFTSALALARLTMPGWMPVSLMLTQHFRSDEKIQTLRMPKLFIYCTGDTTIPGYMGEELHRLAADPKERLVIEGGSHDYCPPTAPDAWMDAMTRIAGISAAGTKQTSP